MKTLQDTVAHFCSDHHLKLNKELGQHFLIDQEVLDAIIAVSDIQKSDTIVEIGPGIGILTKELLKRSEHVTAIELDRHLIPLLTKYISSNEKLMSEPTIIQRNALDVPFPTTPYKVVANIPYQITSPLLRHALLESEVAPTSMTLLIQREVAEKICDRENTGLLTILVALFGKPHIVGIVPPSAFLPPPDVDSAILFIEGFEKPLVSKEVVEKILSLTKAAFSQKRKMLRNTLGQLPDGMEKLKKGGIEPTRRPQTLSIDEWIRLAEIFA